MGLKNFSFPKVHPNILGPGLAQVRHIRLQMGQTKNQKEIFQVADLDLTRSRMNDRQWGSLFFSVLDTRKIDHLVLVGCNLTSANSAVLASAVATIRSVDLSEVKLQPVQVAEVLRKSAIAKGLYYLSLDGVQVPEELLKDKSEDTILAKMRTRYNLYVGRGTSSNTITSVIQ